MQKQPLVSFIIPAFNVDADMLRECLESIMALSLSREEREIAHVLNIQIDVYRLVGRKMLLIRRKRYFGTPKLAMVAILGVERTCRIMKTIYKICKNNR